MRRKTIFGMLMLLFSAMLLPLFAACESDDDDEGGKDRSQSQEYVDLGLSVKWAKCNLGAKNPWENGDYYAWGETSPKKSYDWESYTPIGDGSYSYLSTDNDPAAIRLGRNWHTPTESEFSELLDECKWVWSTENGVEGYHVVGPNGNSIFLPAAGSMDGEENLAAEGYGYYWSNVSYYTEGVYEEGGYHRYDRVTTLEINNSGKKIRGLQGQYGCPIRPVCNK